MTPGPTTPEAAAAVPPVAPRRIDAALGRARKVFSRAVHTASNTARSSRDALTLIKALKISSLVSERVYSNSKVEQADIETLRKMQDEQNQQVAEMLKSTDPHERAAAYDFMKYRLLQQLHNADQEIAYYTDQYNKAEPSELKQMLAVKLQDAKNRRQAMKTDKQKYIGANGGISEMTLEQQAAEFYDIKNNTDTPERIAMKDVKGDPIPDQVMSLALRVSGRDTSRFNPGQENPLTFLVNSLDVVMKYRGDLQSLHLTPDELRSITQIKNEAYKNVVKGDVTTWKETGKKIAKRTLIGLIFLFLMGNIASDSTKTNSQATHG